MSQTVSIRLADETLEKIDMMAKIADRSRAWLMSQTVTQYVEHEAWQLDAIAKSLKKLETGQAIFADHKDVVQWLASWGTEEETGWPLGKKNP